MLLIAALETWIVTIWQPHLVRHDLEWQRAVAFWFAFPFTVSPYMAGFELAAVRLTIFIRFGYVQLFYLVSPDVGSGSAEMVFWFTQIRMLAFRIIFSFHLIAFLLLMLILTSVDVLYRRFHVRAVTKHPKASPEGFSRSSEDGRGKGSN